ncbi:MAG: hypothetical protein HQK83_20630 [Fibrobacteria bacterium]|nr:hypothetical protein [Fibrobacteria bacterium]
MKTVTALFAFLFCFGILFADEPKEPENTSGEPATTVEEKEDDGLAPDKLAKAFGISADSVTGLKTNFKIGYGGVKHALTLAGQCDKTAEEILRMKTEEKKGWGVIKQELGLKSTPEKDVEKAEKSGAKGKKEESMAKKLIKQEEKAQRKMQKATMKAEKMEGKRRGK